LPIFRAISEAPGIVVQLRNPDSLEVECALDDSLPDVAIVDIDLERGRGLEIITQLHRLQNELSPVIMAIASAPSLRVRSSCLEAGAMYFFDKTCEQDWILESLELIRGEIDGPGGGEEMKRLVDLDRT
jgi:DNA-binding response OmpR family regulator